MLGRRNVVNLGRQGEYTEFTYWKHFAKRMDWLAFNMQLVDDHAGPNRIIALDPSSLSKSGKYTAGVGYFHSSVADKRGAWKSPDWLQLTLMIKQPTIWKLSRP